MNLSRLPFAQTAPTVINLSLRYRPKQKTPDYLECKQWSNQKRHDTQSHQPRHRSLTRDNREGLIGRCHQPARECNSLRLIAIEQGCIRPPMQNSRELPRKIHSIADASVHALPANRTMNVGGIPQKKCSTPCEVICDPMMHSIG